MTFKKDMEKLLSDSEGPKKPSHRDMLYAACAPIWSPDMGHRLALMRMSMFFDQRALGEYLGVSQKMISDIERGKLTKPVLISLERLDTLFGDKLNFILFGTSPEKYAFGHIVSEYWAVKNATKGDRITHRWGVPKHEVLARAAERAVKAAERAQREFERIKGLPPKRTRGEK